jgi:DNA polymerase
MNSYQNLILLQNLYRLKDLGFDYIDPFSLNNNSMGKTPTSLTDLEKSLSTCHLCDLSKSRTQTMNGYGNQNAEIMIIDYSVSTVQDSTNSYFSGRSAEILKNMVENVLKVDISDIFYTHAVKCKPLNTNQPSSSEWNSCKSYLFSQIEFIKPKVIITLGADAYNRVTSDEESFENIRGHLIEFKNYKLVPIYHPNFLLRNPQFKKVTLNDLKTIKSCL